VVDPCVPASLGEIRVRRRFRDCDYRITIRPARKGEEAGVFADGVRVDDSPIAPKPGGQVEVVALT